MEQRIKIGHEVEDFATSGMYPGGTNVITDARWGLWDYGGTMAPDSQCALILDLTPLDGSNDNKPHTEYWNVGEAKIYGPIEDGKFMEGTRPATQSCNAFQFIKSLQDNCGMERGRLSVENIGVKVLVGSEITFARVPDTRDRSGFKTNLDPTTGQPKVNKPKEILVATKAKFAWESGKRTATNKTTGTTAPVTHAAPNPTITHASTNGDGDHLSAAIVAVLTDNDGAIELTNLMPKVTEKLSVAAGLSTGTRLKLLKKLKTEDGKSVDPNKLGELSNLWSVDTNDGVVSLN